MHTLENLIIMQYKIFVKIFCLLAQLCLYCYVFWNSFLFLFLENYGVRKLEAVFAVLIATMALSFAWMFAEIKPDAKQLLVGPNLINS